MNAHLQNLKAALNESVQPTVEGFLLILMGALTQYDQRMQKKPSHNRYFLGHAAKAVQNLRHRFKGKENSSSPEDLKALAADIERNVRMGPGTRTVKAIRAYVEKGTLPKYPGVRTPASKSTTGATKPKVKKPTFEEARNSLMTYLDKEGWKISDRSMKIPYATSPDGEFRAWFKKQAVWFTFDPGMRPHHTFKMARSMLSDVREVAGPEFLRDVERWKKIVGESADRQNTFQELRVMLETGSKSAKVPDESDRKHAFGALEAYLRNRLLPTSDGKERHATIDEFMLMSKDGKFYHFKHRNTRNYIYVSIKPGKVVVPNTGKVHQKGYFDEVSV